MVKKEEINHAVICNGLLIEILSRLPPKPLFRFKCVSKAWCNLASEAWLCFLSRHENRERFLPGIFYGLFQVEETGEGYKFYYLPNSQEDKDENKVAISLSFLPCYPDFTIVDCCNGLLLCLSYKIDKRGVFYVCNPLTKRWVSLPKPSAVRGFNEKLFYDPNHPTHFKVLSLLEFKTTGEKMLLIFCSKSGKWVQSTIGGEPSLNWQYSIALIRPVLFKQTLCFLSESFRNNCVIAIDINKQRAQRIKLPCEEYIPGSSLHESEGSLYYIPHFKNTFQIWVLKDLSSKEWALKFVLDMRALDEKIFIVGCPRYHNLGGRYYCPLGLMPYSHKLGGRCDWRLGLMPYCPFRSDNWFFEFGLCGDYFIFRDHCKLLSYNFATKRVELIFGLKLWNSYSTRILLYTPGLMSPDSCRPLLKNQAELAQVELNM